MANQTRRQQDENEFTDVAGRRHNSNGQFVAEDDNDNESRPNGSQNRGRSNQDGDDNNRESNSRGRNTSNRGGQSQNRVISRAVRVLDEIETRLHELREELEAQSGGQSSSEGRSAGGRNGSRSDDDEDVVPGGQGRVKHPETDHRLRQNREDDDNDGRPANGRQAAGGNRNR